MPRSVWTDCCCTRAGRTKSSRPSGRRPGGGPHARKDETQPKDLSGRSTGIQNGMPRSMPDTAGKKTPPEIRGKPALRFCKTKKGLRGHRWKGPERWPGPSCESATNHAIARSKAPRWKGHCGKWPVAGACQGCLPGCLAVGRSSIRGRYALRDSR